ncbi:MAG: hypothetical protein IKN08_03535 [Bacteroidales bacterium]|nr:hypothetical protein [Bacteroidales bacterium]
MNRIILLGNGFDLAHGLKTSYADFIDWYWDKRVFELKTALTNVTNDALCALEINSEYYKTWSLYFFLHGHEIKSYTSKEIISGFDEIKTHFRVSKSDFFSRISSSDPQWSNIEYAYYRLLFPHDIDASLSYKDKPSELNEQLAFVRGKLIEYLTVIQNEKIIESIAQQSIKEKLFAPIRKKDIAVGSFHNWKEMIDQHLSYSSETWQEIASTYGVSNTDYLNIDHLVHDNPEKIRRIGIENLHGTYIPDAFFLPDRIMLLNFNYTNTADLYIDKCDRLGVNHIHGELTNPESVIFGYGDELDENYKKIVNKNDNEYLRNIKSVKYLESSNYRDLLAFIESDTYQIFIMGHSCGNSDRTLLNTLFEHRNCVSIKPFYHKWDDGTDNYMELVQNISRNFTDMKLMRDRVVNKTFCDTI